MAQRKQNWTLGDVFAVPMSDGRFAVGQIVGREPEVLNSVTVALFDQTWPSAEETIQSDVSEARAFTIIFSTRDLLDLGKWKVVGNLPVRIQRELLPYQHTRSSGWVGAKVVGSGILTKFIEAYFGLATWDHWKDPAYLDKMLLSPDRKPKTVILKGNRAQ